MSVEHSNIAPPKRPYIWRRERNGQTEYFYRRNGKTSKLPGAPDSPEFEEAYHALHWGRGSARKRAPAHWAGPIAPEFDFSTEFDLIKSPSGLPFDKEIERAARTRAKRSGLPYELPAGWVRETYMRQKGLCKVSGMPMRRDRPRRSPYLPTIDRIDSSAGYVERNCRLVCYIVNCGMNMFSDGEFIEMCKAVSGQTPNVWRT